MKILFQFAVLGASALGSAVWFQGCANPPTVAIGQQKNVADRVEAEAFFLGWRRSLQANNWDAVAAGLNRETQFWLSDVVRSSRMDDGRQLAELPFETVVLVLTLRVDRRLDPALDDRLPALMARFLTEGSPIRRSFLKAELGDFTVRGNQAELGLREAPRVPVFYFEREDRKWRLALRNTLPLVMRGAESLSRPHGQNRLDQAVWLLKNWGGRDVLPEDVLR
jgi:hypothetical protein